MDWPVAVVPVLILTPSPTVASVSSPTTLALAEAVTAAAPAPATLMVTGMIFSSATAVMDRPFTPLTVVLAFRPPAAAVGVCPDRPLLVSWVLPWLSVRLTDEPLLRLASGLLPPLVFTLPLWPPGVLGRLPAVLLWPPS